MTATHLDVGEAQDGVISRWLIYLFFAAVFFPYIQVAPVGSDVQPAALVLGIAVVLSSTTGRLPKLITPLFVVLVAAVLVSLVIGIDATAVRGLANYFSLFLIAFATYSALKSQGGLSRRFISATIWIWFAAGFLQVFVNRHFLSFLLSNARTTADRGVVGLAPEPTAYGIHCLMLLIIVPDLFTGQQRKWLTLALLVQIIVFARSSMAILFLLIWGVTSLAARAGLRRSMTGGIILSAVLFVVVRGLAQVADKVQGVRVLSLIKIVATAPALILVRDQSVSDRVAAITFSIAGAFNNWFIPHGLTSWSSWVKEIGPRLARYIPYYTAGDRIMSGYGAAIYELGFVGLLIPYVVTRSASLHYASDRPRLVTIAVVLNLLLLTALPLAYPPIAFVIGYFCYYGIQRAHAGTGDVLSTCDNAERPLQGEPLKND